jgi:hypothetical protein
MKCVTCGAEMRLMQVEQRGDPNSEVAFERHTFKCSACLQLSQRMVFSRSRLLSTGVGVAPPPKHSASANLQMRRLAGAHALAKVVEKLRIRRRRIDTEARATAPTASIWPESFEKPQSLNTPVQEQQDQSAKARTTPTWAEVVEKVRTRQMASGAGALPPPIAAASNPRAGKTQGQ